MNERAWVCVPAFGPKRSVGPDQRVELGTTRVWLTGNGKCRNREAAGNPPRGSCDCEETTDLVHPRPDVMEDVASGQPSDTPWSRLTDGARTWDAGAGTPDSTVSPDLRGSCDTVCDRSRNSLCFSLALPGVGTSPRLISPKPASASMRRQTSAERSYQLW